MWTQRVRLLMGLRMRVDDWWLPERHHWEWEWSNLKSLNRSSNDAWLRQMLLSLGMSLNWYSLRLLRPALAGCAWLLWLLEDLIEISKHIIYHVRKWVNPLWLLLLLLGLLWLSARLVLLNMIRLLNHVYGFIVLFDY